MNAKRMALLGRAAETWDIDLEKGKVYTSFGEAKSINTYGYISVGTWVDGVYRKFSVHEIIAYFGGLDILNKQVNHISGNKLDNSIQNLEGISLEENLRHAHKNGLFPEPLKGSDVVTSKLTSNDVEYIRKEYEDNYYYGIGTSLASMFGVSRATISTIKDNKRWNQLCNEAYKLEEES